MLFPTPLLSTIFYTNKFGIMDMGPVVPDQVGTGVNITFNCQLANIQPEACQHNYGQSTHTLIVRIKDIYFIWYKTKSFEYSNCYKFKLIGYFKAHLMPNTYKTKKYNTNSVLHLIFTLCFESLIFIHHNLLSERKIYLPSLFHVRHYVP